MKPRRGQRGLSLIELMIAMALGLILTLGVVQIFLGSSQTYRLTDSLARLQENIRFSLDFLKWEARMAGYRGCTSNINNMLDVDENDPAVAGFFRGIPVEGWDYAGTEPDEAYELSVDTAGDFVGENAADIPDEIQGLFMAGSDVLIINRARRADVVVSGVPSGTANTINADGASNIPQGAIVVAVDSNCGKADMFQNTNNGNADTVTKGNGGDPGNVSGNFSDTYEDGASLMIHTSTAYFIGEGTNGGPALFRYVLDATGSGNAEELVEGIENMQVLYGVSNDIDTEVDSYETADDVADWGSVVSLRIALLTRSVDDNILDFGAVDEADPRSFNLAGTRIDLAESDRRARLVSTTTVGLRNRLN